MEEPSADPNRIDAIQEPSRETWEEDLLLVRSILDNHRDRVVQFIDRLECIPRILAARNRQLGRPLSDSELDDVAQDTLAIVWRKLPNFEGRSSLETWIYRIAVFELMNAIRRRSKRPGGRRLDLADVDVPIETEDYDDTSDLHAALEDLDSEEAEIIRAKHFEGESFSELAERLHVSLGTAKSRYYRGMRRLRHLLIHRQSEYEL